MATMGLITAVPIRELMLLIAVVMGHFLSMMLLMNNPFLLLILLRDPQVFTKSKVWIKLLLIKQMFMLKKILQNHLDSLHRLLFPYKSCIIFSSLALGYFMCVIQISMTILQSPICTPVVMISLGATFLSEWIISCTHYLVKTTLSEQIEVLNLIQGHCDM